ncbi:phosphatase PAP2 family protein [Deinococcus radiotolerans]|nr:phosphatase PAP2 family protein [Deinococcus radiotolerans]
MTDPIQQAAHHAALQSPVLRQVMVVLAADLIALLAAAFAALLIVRRANLTRGTAVRIGLSGTLAVLLTLLLGHAVHDPRPFLAEHYVPLTHAATDNGFPSDHVLVAALLTGWAAWLGRWWPGFAVGTVAIAAGRLGVGAHHTLDVLGSVVIAGLSVLAAHLVPLSGGWTAPLLPLRRGTLMPR